ncbi:MAG TPA: hypothetical protein VFV00_12435 [Acidimicrobiales bacterium]|nr:hypothetical protein [Acidimicrobiales bacterium]
MLDAIQPARGGAPKATRAEQELFNDVRHDQYCKRRLRHHADDRLPPAFMPDVFCHLCK